MPALQVEHFLERSAAVSPEKVALVCGGRSWTYREINGEANRLANLLREHGLQRGDRVAVYVDNLSEAVISIFAALKAGGVFMMINPTTKVLDLCMLGLSQGLTPEQVHRAAGLTPEITEHIFRDIESKRRSTAYLHAPALLVDLVFADDPTYE